MPLSVQNYFWLLDEYSEKQMKLPYKAFGPLIERKKTEYHSYEAHEH
jgi:hypothetical protein